MEKLLKHFDAVFYINRMQDTERNKHMQELLKDSPIPIHRVEAVVPQSIDLSGILQNNITRYDKKPYHVCENTPQKLKEICCSISHANVWHTAKQMRLSNVLVLEDDVEFIDYNDEFDYLPPNSHMTYLNYFTFHIDCGAWLAKNGYYIDIYKRNDFWHRTEGGVFSTSAYALHLDNFEHNKFNEIVGEMASGVICDYFMSNVVQPNFNVNVAIEPLLKCSDKFDTTIGEDYKGIKQAYEYGIINDLDDFEHTNTKHQRKYKHQKEKHLTFVVNNSYEDIILHDNDFDADFSMFKDFGKFLEDLDEPIYLDGHSVKVFTTEFTDESTENGTYPNRGVKKYIFKHECDKQPRTESKDVLHEVENQLYDYINTL